MSEVIDKHYIMERGTFRYPSLVVKEKHDALVVYIQAFNKGDLPIIIHDGKSYIEIASIKKDLLYIQTLLKSFNLGVLKEDRIVYDFNSIEELLDKNLLGYKGVT